MHKQVSVWTVNFCPNSRESPFLEFQTRKPPSPRKMKNFRFEMTKVYSGIPFQKPQNEKLQIWDDQSLLQNTPPPPTPGKTSDLRWPKFTLKYPPPPPRTKWKTSDLRWPKFTPEYTTPPLPIGLDSGRSYVETNLYPLWIPLVSPLTHAVCPWFVHCECARM